MIFDFGYRLRELRVSKSLTQAQVASRMNLSKTTISGYENNIKTPSLDMLVNLSILYGVTSDYILGIDNRRMLMTEGLTQRQQELVKELVDEFMNERRKNSLG